MSNSYTKAIVVLVLASMLAIVFVPACDAEPADVADVAVQDDAAKTEVYTIYFEFNDGNNKFMGKVGTSAQADVSKASLSAAVNEVCAVAGYKATYNDGWASSFTVDNVAYTASTVWGVEPYHGFSQFYLDDSGEWKPINKYNEGTTVVIVFGEYKFSDPQNTEDYFADPYGWWTPKTHIDLNTINDVDYKIYLEFNDNGKRTTISSDAVAQSDVSKASLSAAVNEVCRIAGITTDFKAGWASSFTVDGVDYVSSTEWGVAPYFGYAQYYLDDAGNWKAISTYDEGSTVSIVFGEYKFTDPMNAEDYNDTGWGYWQPATHVVIEDHSSNWVLPAAVIGIIAIALVLLFVVKRN